MLPRLELRRQRMHESIRDHYSDCVIVSKHEVEACESFHDEYVSELTLVSLDIGASVRVEAKRASRVTARQSKQPLARVECRFDATDVSTLDMFVVQVGQSVLDD